MCEFDCLDRCAAYVATRGALEAVHRASTVWPDELAEHAKRAAIDTVMTTAESLSFDHGTSARRRCVRAAITTAIELAAACDVARAMGLANGELERAQRHAGRAVALLGLLFHSSANPFPED